MRAQRDAVDLAAAALTTASVPVRDIHPLGLAAGPVKRCVTGWEFAGAAVESQSLLDLVIAVPTVVAENSARFGMRVVE